MYHGDYAETAPRMANAEGGNPVCTPLNLSYQMSKNRVAVIPAKAGIQWIYQLTCCTTWIPAFAGMTNPLTSWSDQN